MNMRMDPRRVYVAITSQLSVLQVLDVIAIKALVSRRRTEECLR